MGSIPIAPSARPLKLSQQIASTQERLKSLFQVASKRCKPFHTNGPSGKRPTTAVVSKKPSHTCQNGQLSQKNRSNSSKLLSMPSPLSGWALSSEKCQTKIGQFFGLQSKTSLQQLTFLSAVKSPHPSRPHAQISHELLLRGTAQT